MTIASTTNRVSYAGNGSTTVFSFPYYFLQNADLVVVKRDNTTGVETTQTITTNYTITGAGVPAGGSVTMLAAPASGETLIIYRSPAATQDLDLVENDPMPAEEIEERFDKLTMISQRLKDRLDRAVTLSDGFSPTFSGVLPGDLDAAGDKVPLINSAGTGFADAADWPTASDISNAEANATSATASAAAALASQTAAASSEANAAAAVASAFYRDVLYKTFADSPITLTSADNGKLLAFDSSGGAISVTLPQISALTPPFNVAFLLKTAGNTVTITRAGSDTIMGATTKTLTAANTGFQLVADTGASPDDWSAMDFGTVADAAVTKAKLDSTTTFQPDEITNLGLSASVASNALTVTLRDSAGSTPSATSPVTIGFRSSTATSGTPVRRQVTGALSMVVSSGSTLGHVSAVSNFIHVYAIDNAGTVELAVCSLRIPDNGTLVSTTAEGGAGAADSESTLYSTTARSNVAIRYLGRLRSNQTTAGTWAAVPTEIAVGVTAPFPENYSQVTLTIGNGYGSTGTAIRRFTTSATVGSDLTYADSATNGASVTVNTSGVYGIDWSDKRSTSDVNFGISVNQSGLTTTPDSLTFANGSTGYVTISAATGDFGTISRTLRLKAGDVIRPNANGNIANDVLAYFKVTRIG